MMGSFRVGLVFVVAFALAQLPASASGSVSPGGAKAAASAGYSRGKAITFRELVCRNCPINKRGFNRERAGRLKESIDAALAGRSGGSETDSIQALCATDREGCAGKLEAVQQFLTRRYKL